MPLICALCAVRINIVSFGWILVSYMNFKQTFSQRNLPFYCLSGSCPHHNPWPSINTDRTLLQLHYADTSQDPAHSRCPESQRESRWLGGWGRNWLCNEMEPLFLTVSPKKEKAGRGATAACGLQPLNGFTVLSQGWEFSIIWSQLTEENAKIITIWGKSRIPFVVLLPFCWGTKAFRNCSLHEEPVQNQCGRLRTVTNKLFSRETSLYVNNAATCSCCIKLQNIMLFCMLEFEQMITSAL